MDYEVTFLCASQQDAAELMQLAHDALGYPISEIPPVAEPEPPIEENNINGQKRVFKVESNTGQPFIIEGSPEKIQRFLERYQSGDRRLKYAPIGNGYKHR